MKKMNYNENIQLKNIGAELIINNAPKSSDARTELSSACIMIYSAQPRGCCWLAVSGIKYDGRHPSLYPSNTLFKLKKVTERIRHSVF